MKTERRHELATNELADMLAGLIEIVKPYSMYIGGTLVAVVMLIGVAAFYSNKSKVAEAEGWNELFAIPPTAPDRRDKLLDVADAWAGTPVGVYAVLLAANDDLREGAEKLFEDRADARTHLRDAADGFKRARSESSESLVQEQACIGLARAHECLNELDEARTFYKEIVDRWPKGMYGEYAKTRLEDLDRPTTRSFYDWFATQDPKPPAISEPGTPGERPALDSNPLDSVPDLSPPDPFSESSGGTESGDATPPLNNESSTSPGSESSTDPPPVEP
jgi:hypothetical protein